MLTPALDNFVNVCKDNGQFQFKSEWCPEWKPRKVIKVRERDIILTHPERKESTYMKMPTDDEIKEIEPQLFEVKFKHMLEETPPMLYDFRNS